MPQGRKKVPFSGKAKKEQMKAKKQEKQGAVSKNTILVQNSYGEHSNNTTRKLNFQPTKGVRSNTNRYALQFHRESDDEIKLLKEQARHSLEKLSEDQLEVNFDDYFPRTLDFPKRPPWSFNLTKEELELRENKYFTEYVQKLQKEFSWKELSYFEMNLETWRQFWRVLEMSDIILFIVDIRYPLFPPSFYEYVNRGLLKDVILVLNKIDLVPAPLVAAWKRYFREKFDGLYVVTFTSLPRYNLRGNASNKAGLQIRRQRGKFRMAAEGTQMLLETCKSIVHNEVDLTSWQQKIEEEMLEESDYDDKVEVGKTINLKEVDTSYFNHKRCKNGTLTIGCIGQPNVGKSSLMNAIMGKKVVSVSKTPGHTKHFQTIFLTQNVQLCDCPGLVFPSKIPKQIQVLMGCFPIAQLREPYTSVKYLAERLDLPKLLRINHPEGDDIWSAMDICDGWAKKRGFLTAKAARLDTYRAANNLLRMALDGKICLYFRPPGYSQKKEYWASQSDVPSIQRIQGMTKGDSASEPIELSNSDSSDEDETETNEEDSEDGEIEVNTNKFSVLQVI